MAARTGFPAPARPYYSYLPICVFWFLGPTWAGRLVKARAIRAASILRSGLLPLGRGLLGVLRAGKIAGCGYYKPKPLSFSDKKRLHHFFGPDALLGIGQQAILDAVLHFAEFDD